MRASQLLFEFGKSVLRPLRRPPPPPPQPTPRSPTRDPSLEKLGRRLLQAAGWPNSNVQVQWNPRLRTTAGMACWSSLTISLNPRLREISPSEVERTLRHELAHFLAQSRAGRRRIAAHGPEWRQACCDLGIPGEPRCHDLPFVRGRRTRKYFYACPRCGTPLARVRPIRRPLACLGCCRRHNHGRYDARFRFVPVDTAQKAVGGNRCTS